MLANSQQMKRKGEENMARDFLTDEQVEKEITRLLKSDDVKLAKKETRIKMKRRQYMYQLLVIDFLFQP